MMDSEEWMNLNKVRHFLRWMCVWARRAHPGRASTNCARLRYAPASRSIPVPPALIGPSLREEEEEEEHLAAAAGGGGGADVELVA